MPVVPQVTSGFRPFAATSRVGSVSYNDPINKEDPLGLRPTDVDMIDPGIGGPCSAVGGAFGFSAGASSMGAGSSLEEVVAAVAAQLGVGGGAPAPGLASMGVAGMPGPCMSVGAFATMNSFLQTGCYKINPDDEFTYCPQGAPPGEEGDTGPGDGVPEECDGYEQITGQCTPNLGEGGEHWFIEFTIGCPGGFCLSVGYQDGQLYIGYGAGYSSPGVSLGTSDTALCESDGEWGWTMAGAIPIPFVSGVGVGGTVAETESGAMISRPGVSATYTTTWVVTGCD